MNQSLQHRLENLKNRAWELAKESLDQGENEVSRLLFDMTERLTGLLRNGASSDWQTVDKPLSERGAVQQRIFARYKGERFYAELNVNRINGGRGACVRFKGKWQTPSAAAMSITETQVNGWRFWKYDRADGTVGIIDELRK